LGDDRHLSYKRNSENTITTGGKLYPARWPSHPTALADAIAADAAFGSAGDATGEPDNAEGKSDELEFLRKQVVHKMRW